MLTYVIREKKIKKKSEVFIHYFFSIKKLINRYKREQNRICLIHIPVKKKRKKKYYGKICKIIQKKGVKKICIQDMEDQYLINTLKSRFEVVKGKGIFVRFFKEIIEFIAEKKGISIEECELILISNNPKDVKELILKCVKTVKDISVFTTYSKNFSKMQEEILKEFGIFVRCIGKNQNLKKYNRIYVNCETLPLFSKDYFSKVLLFDLYHIYQKAYTDVYFSYKTEDDDFINTEKIEKDLSFTEMYFENNGYLKEKIKIIDIKNKD